MLRFINFIFFFLLGSLFLRAECGAQATTVSEPVNPWDEGVVSYRQPPYGQIEEWKNMRAYRYDRETFKADFWAIIWNHIMRFVSSLTRSGNWFLVMLALVGFSLIVLLVLRILNVPVSSIFFLSRNRETTDLLFSEGVHGQSRQKLEEMLVMYRRNGAWPEAVRILFLLYLQRLQAGDIIRLKSFKTNHEYLAEIQSSSEKAIFLKRMNLFNRIWYGQALLTEDLYQKVEHAFSVIEEKREEHV